MDAIEIFLNEPHDCFINDDPLPTTASLNGFAMPPNLSGDDFSLDDLFDENTNHSNELTNMQPDGILNGIDDLNTEQMRQFSDRFDELLNGMVILSNNNSNHVDTSTTENTTDSSLVIKSSNPTNTISFIDGNQVIRTRGSLQLTVPPLSYQRVRYENELIEILRYVFVPNNDSITLKISILLNMFAPHMSTFMRITRLTLPYGPDNLVFTHPYPIWLNDEEANVYNSSLIIPVNQETIKIPNLVLSRAMQRALSKIKQFPIFASNQLNFTNFHSLHLPKTKDIIDQYQLRYSILHFQIIFADQNNIAYLTDLECQTEPIYEYEGRELGNLPIHIRDIMKLSIKRKQIGQRKETRKVRKEK